MKENKLQILKNSFNTSIVIIVIQIVVIYFSINYNLENKNLLHEYSKNAYDSYLLADKLRQSSDDLTRLVRTYIATGDTFYKKQYYKVLDIRNGVSPAPVNYNQPYWDLISKYSDETKSNNLDLPISLKQEMIIAKFTEVEFNMLEKAEMQSNNLVVLEEKAMAIIEDTITGDEMTHKTKAIKILFGKDYHQTKVAIMTPIKDFYVLFKQRTGAKVVEQEKKVNTLDLFQTLQILIMIITAFAMFLIGRKLSSIIIKDLEKHVRIKTEFSEKMNLKNNALVTKNKELSHFTYIASHDLQEPLNTIIGFSKILKEKYYDKLEGIGQKSIEIIDISSIRMKNLTIGLLEYSRIGKKAIPKIVNVNALIEGVKTDLTDLIGQNEAVITYKDLSVISAYENELEMLFSNLITNAIKYRKDNISPKIEIVFEETAKEYMYSVIDNGIGIDMQFKDKIFEIFQRLHTNDQYSGTGIGLANCTRIAELHKGSIWVESEIDKGSNFSFTIKKGLKDE